MGIGLRTSPNNYALLSGHVSHLHAFEERHFLNPHAKKWYNIPKIRSVCNGQYTVWPPLARIQA